MFCKNCGKEVDDQAVICPGCGVPTTNSQPGAAAAPSNGDAPNAGFAVLGFFFPIIGLILYLVWHKDYPLKAKSCGKGALIGVIVYVVLIVIVVIIAISMYSAMIGAMNGALNGYYPFI